MRTRTLFLPLGALLVGCSSIFGVDFDEAHARPPADGERSTDLGPRGEAAGTESESPAGSGNAGTGAAPAEAEAGMCNALEQLAEPLQLFGRVGALTLPELGGPVTDGVYVAVWSNVYGDTENRSYGTDDSMRSTIRIRGNQLDERWGLATDTTLRSTSPFAVVGNKLMIGTPSCRWSPGGDFVGMAKGTFDYKATPTSLVIYENNAQGLPAVESFYAKR